jgi:hypothetical protein
VQIIRMIAAVIAAVAALVSCGSGPASASTVAHAAGGATVISGLDLHDGTVIESGSTWYLYGTRYGCGFAYGTKGTPWCGYGVSTAASAAGPWSTPVLMFSPGTVISAAWAGDNGESWSAMCGGDGQGCFNPRMIHAPDGTWLLWFNAPGDKNRSANPYWVMTCSGPGGPCGSPAKPAIYSPCNKGGDFSLAVQGTTGYLECSGSEHQLFLEPLDAAMSAGLDSGITVTGAIGEGEGIYHSSAGYTMVFSDPVCGYCSGTAAASPGAVAVSAGVATAASLAGPWTLQADEPGGTCLGQPRSAFSAGGEPYEWVDRWTGSKSEPGAAVALIPFSLTPWTCG